MTVNVGLVRSNLDSVSEKYPNLPDVMRSTALYFVSLTLLAIITMEEVGGERDRSTNSEGAVGGRLRFTPEAAQFVKVRYRKTTRGRDFTELVVEMTPSSMVEGAMKGGQVVNVLRLEVKKGEGGCWKEEKTAPSPRSGGITFRWRVEIQPCLAHQVRLRMDSKDLTCTSYLLVPHIVSPGEGADLSGYRPRSPEQLTISRPEEGTGVTVGWSQVECSDSYEVRLNNYEGEEVVMNITGGETSVTLPRISSCEEHDVMVVAGNKEKLGEETSTTFNPCSLPVTEPLHLQPLPCPLDLGMCSTLDRVLSEGIRSAELTSSMADRGHLSWLVLAACQMMLMGVIGGR